MRRSRALLSIWSVITVATGVLVTIPVTASATPPSSGPGSADTSFGSAGIALLPAPAGANGLTSLNRMVVQPDGRILAGALIQPSHKTVVYRLNTDGSLDTGFGAGGSIVISPSISSSESTSAIAEDGDGRIYVGGGSTDGGGGSALFLQRYTSSGALDTSYGTNGTLTVDFAGQFGNQTHANDHITDLVVQPDGKLVASAWVGQGGGADFVVARFTAAGALDPTFAGGAGFASTDFNGGDDTARSVALQPDGKIVVAGFAKSSGNAGDDTGLVRYNTDGTIDTSFGTSGKVESDFGSGQNDGAWGVMVGSDGFITVTGFDYGDNVGYLARYTDSGAFEGSFAGNGGNGGSMQTSFGGSTAGNFSVAADPDGRILVAGPSVQKGNASATDLGVDRFVDARYPYDTTWNSSGQETVPCSSANGGGAAVASTVSGQVVAAMGCGDTLEVAQLNGGNDVPVGTTVTGGDPGDFAYTVSNVNGPDAGNVVHVGPGGSFNLSLHYAVTQSQSYCPGCIDQLQLGFVNDGSTQCAYDNGIFGGSASGDYTGTFVAPTKPGTYYLGSSPNQQYSCITDWGAEPVPAQYVAKVVVGGVTSVNVSADVATAPAGHLATPTSAIPPSALQAAGTGLQSSPLRSTPLRSTPLRSTPLRSTPLRSTPLRSTPLRSTPLRSTAIAPIPLTDAPLLAPKSWPDVLAQPASDGTTPNPYADQPLQNVTLQQVLSLTGYPAVDALTLGDIDWSQTAARGISVGAFLLGGTPLANLPAPTGGWCAYLTGKALSCGADATFPATHSLADLQLGGDDVSDYLSGTPITLNGLTLADSALTNMLLEDLQLDQTPYGDAPAGSYATCSGCTFAEAENGSTFTLSTTATLGQLLADPSSSLPTVTLGELLPGIVPTSDLGPLPLTTVVNASPYPTTGLVTYTVNVGLDCTEAGTLDVAVHLPPGFRHVPGSDTLTTSAAASAGALSVTGSTSKLTTVSAPVSCDGAAQATLTMKAEPGVQLGGPFTTNVTASFDGSSLTDPADAPVTVVDHQPPAQAQADTIYLGHISQPGELDSYSLDSSSLQPGSQITATLSNVPSGQDFDLVLFGPPAPELRSSPLRSTPLRSTPLRSTATGDTSLDPTSDGTTAQPDPQADVPMTAPTGEVFRAESINRGTTDESVTTTVGDGESGGYTIQVSGYNGSSSPSPYMLQITVTPPAGALPCAPLNVPHAGEGVAGSLPSTPLSGDTQTLFLVNEKRLGDFYGTAGESSVVSALQTLASRSDVRGVVIPVEGDPNVAAAYSAWDASPCSPSRADDVVAAINGLVDSMRTGLGQLRNIVIVGDDQIVPMARVVDHTVVSNEQEYAGAAAFDGQDNAESRSLADGYMLTDDAYGSFNPIPWMESSLYVPNVALGRLVETPTDITNAITAYVAANGIRTPSAGFTTGYDFMTSEANAIDTALTANLPAVGSTGSESSQINETWTKPQALAGVAGAAHGIIALNAHYDNYRALPADEFTAGTENSLITTADLPADMSGAVMFTIGCHSGLNLADTFVASPTAAEAAKLADWAQTVSSHGGQLLGNTGFGYGDTDTIAYSAALMVGFAQNLNGTMTVGQALMFAKQGYLHLPMGVYDAKALQEATFYGLPMYRLGPAGQVAPPALPSAPATSSSVTTVAGSPQSASFSGPDPSLVPHTTTDGTYYTVHHSNGTDDKPLVVQNEPVEPQTSVPYGPRTDGLVAHGVTLDGLSTYTTSASADFNPVFDKPNVDLSQFAPEPQISNAFFPATLDGLVSAQTPTGPKDTVVLTPGQFRSTGDNRGYQVLADSMGYHINYSNSTNFTPPTILATDATVTPDNANAAFTVTVDSGDPGGVTDVTVLYLAQASTAPQQWTRVPLTPGSDGHTWTAFVANVGGHATIGQYLVQATDASGNVAESANKGQDFSAVQAPTAAGAPTIAVSGATTDGVYTAPPTITLDGGTGPLTFSIDNGAVHTYTGPFTVTANGTHTITAQDSTGAAATTVFAVSTAKPVVTITSPGNGATYVFGQVPAATFSCTSLLPITSCDPSPATPNGLGGDHTFSVTGTDAVGNSTTTTVTYHVSKAATTTSVSCTPSVLVSGPTTNGTTACTATVAMASGTALPTPTGTVSFSGTPSSALGTGSCTLATVAGVTSCQASLTVLAAGAASVTASYGGDGNYLPSTSSSAAALTAYSFVGFLQPVNDPAGTAPSVFKAGSTIPLKFQVKDVAGALIPDTVAQTIASSCQATVSIVSGAGTTSSVNETVVSTTADAGVCFRYDSTAKQFIFNLSTTKLSSGKQYQITVTLTGTIAGRHWVVVGLK